MKIRIGLLGYGRTGSVVAKEIVADPKLSLEWVCRRSVPAHLKFASHSLGYDKSFAPFIREIALASSFEKHPVDVVIDFSSSNAVNLYSAIAKSGAKIISAISSYSEEQLAQLKDISKSTAVLHSPNITLGINWLMFASKMLQKIIPAADIEVVEEHFRDKKDISGTALKLAKHLHLEVDKHVNSIRVGGIIGKHEVIFGLPHQTLRLTHESINRAAFGAGAIFATKWILSKDPGLYSMESVVQEKFLKNLKDLF